MKHLINLIEYLEGNHHYSQVDEMIKTALDLSQLDSSEEGYYAKYYSEISPREKEKIKDELGQIPDEIGIKQYKMISYGNAEIIKDNLALIYIAPYVASMTGFKTPTIGANMPLSSVIAKRINVMQHLPGIHLDKYLEKHFDWDMQEAFVSSTESSITKQLNEIDVYTNDLHPGNYLINQKIIDLKLKIIKSDPQFSRDFRVLFKKYPEWFDVSEGASLLDFGSYSCLSSSPPGQAIEAFVDKLITSNPDNSLFREIKDVLRTVVV
mgnify:CR=1 FL=1